MDIDIGDNFVLLDKGEAAAAASAPECYLGKPIVASAVLDLLRSMETSSSHGIS